MSSGELAGNQGCADRFVLEREFGLLSVCDVLCLVYSLLVLTMELRGVAGRARLSKAGAIDKGIEMPALLKLEQAKSEGQNK